MAFLEIQNVAIKGVAAAVPKQIEENTDYPFFQGDEADKFIKATGIERRHADNFYTFMDLSIHAINQIIEKLEWEKSDIDAIIVVTQSPEYPIPATSCILQDKIGLSEECYALDISLGCSGWVYGLSVLSSLCNTGSIKKGLLVVGDTRSGTGIKDKSAYPLFGDAATVTALEYTPNNEVSLKFHLATDGSGYDAIIIPDGGNRNKVTPESLVDVEVEQGIIRNKTNTVLEGMNVFSFGISKPPQAVNNFLNKFDLTLDEIDYVTFHQANKFMNEKIRKKLKVSEEKFLYSLKDFGNTSSASIPLTLVTQISKDLRSSKLKHLACGFGVGLSWATVFFETNNIVCCDLIEV